MKQNAKQKQAVEYVDGPLLIVAGAGTGKTTVITEKVKGLLESGVDADKVLALTFTEKAAEEMVERLDAVMPLSYKEPWVSTFHRFGNRVLGDEALEIGLDPAFEIMTESAAWICVKKHLFEFDLKYYRPLGNPHRFIGAMLKFFSRAKDEDVSVEELRAYANGLGGKANSEDEIEEAEKLKELVRAWFVYEELKIKNSVVDFGDLISLVLKLFRERKSVLKKYREQFEYVLVDEFQDTNFAQYQLVKLLCPPEKKPKLTVVGDDSQSIYRFRGAAISNILQFMNDYKSADKVVLTDNYRSQQAILDGAYKLIENNNPESLESRLGIEKKLLSRRKSKNKNETVVVEAKTGEMEVEFVVKKIYELLAKGGCRYSDFAIAARANSQLEPYVAALKQVSLPYQRVGNRGLFDQEEIALLLQFLRVVADQKDSQSLFQFLFHKDFGVDGELVLKLVREAREGQVSLWDVVTKEKKCREVAEVLRKAIKKVGSARPTKILYEFVYGSKFLSGLLAEETLEQMLKVKNINLFFQYVSRLEESDKELSVVELVEMLEGLMEAGENPSQAEVEDVDAIVLTTTHSSKGLEFGNVFMVSLVAGRFPTSDRKDAIEFPLSALKEDLGSGDRVAEERRLFYVGMTRAKDNLYLTWSSDYGGKRKWKASGFLAETGLVSRSYEGKTQLSLLEIAEDEVPTIKLGEDKFELTKTSYSQIDTFKACPLKFKYRYVLRVPAEPHHALAFGRGVHETLREFHQREMRGEGVDEELILTLYKKYFSGEGYETAEHKKLRYETGKTALKNYVKKYKKMFGRPVMLEKPFRLKINDVVLVGTIDRIDAIDGGHEIIDYKTGSLKNKKEVDRDEQLSIYTLAAAEVLGIETQKQALYFVENEEKVETTRSKAQLARKRKDLEKIIEEMKKSKFPAKPGFVCGYCEFKRICPFASKQ